VVLVYKKRVRWFTCLVVVDHVAFVFAEDDLDTF
jgi:hypothetical protein